MACGARFCAGERIHQERATGRRNGSYRGLRGGSFNNNDNNLHASNRSIGIDPTYESSNVGFRVSEVPEPATIVMLSLAGVGILRRKRA